MTAEIRWTEEQRQAIAHRQGPLRIIAGAGSGKTLTMTEHIVSMITSGYARADQIVALTFTNAAADELTQRIRSRLEDQSVSVWSGTYHSYGMQVVRDGAATLGLPANPRLLSPAESWLVLRNLLREGVDLDYLDISYGLSRAVGEVGAFISRCKDELVSPDDVAGYLETVLPEDEDHLARMRDYHRLYAAYQERCRGLGGIDFGDQIALAVRALQQDENLLADYRKRYKVFIVDEYQDTNYAQSVFVELLATPDFELRIVGDPNQSIYRFRGAAVDNIQRFSEEIPDVTDVSLTTNFRSHQQILDLANTLVRAGDMPALELRAAGERQGPRPVIASGVAFSDEVAWIAETLKAHYEQARMTEREPSLAVLVRKRKLLPEISQALEKAGLPFEVYGDRTIFDSDAAKDVIATLAVLAEPASQLSLVRVLMSPRYGMHQRAISRLRRAAEREMLLDALRTIIEDGPADLSPEDIRSLQRFYDDMRGLVSRTAGLPLDAICREIRGQRATTFSEFDLEALHQLETLAASFSENVVDTSIEAFVDYLNAIEELGGEEANVELVAEPDAIALMTVHGAKGLEFDVVIIAGANANDFGTFGGSSLGPVPPPLLHNAHEYPSRDEFVDRAEYEKAIKLVEERFDAEEERRLFYVAITRARDHLYFSWSESHPTRTRPTTVYPLLAEVQELADTATIPPRAATLFESPILDFFKETGVPLSPGDDFAAFRDAWREYWTARPDGELALRALHDGFAQFQSERPERERTVARFRYLRRQRQFEPLPPDHYSYSLIATYERCPRLYLHRYVIGIPPPPAEVGYTDLGSRFHDALHQAHIVGDGDQQLNFLRIFDLAAQGQGSGGDGRESVARKIAEAYVQSDDVNAEVLAVEPEFYLKLGSGRHAPILYGLIDRIQRRPSGEIEIVDYKTHRDAWTRDEVAADLQLPIYVMAAREALGYEPAYATMAFMRHDVRHEFPVDELDLAGARERIDAVVAGITSRDFGCRCAGVYCAM